MSLNNPDNRRSERTGKIFSKDGTRIAFQRIGHGQPVILVDPALCYRKMGPGKGLAGRLAEHFSVYTYDRRGRGESGDTTPYAVEREVEDIAALLSEAGGSAYLWGTSSSAVLALEAVKRLSGITKVALYEAPLIVDASRSAMEDHWTKINEALAADNRSQAVKQFLTMVGVPGFVIVLMKLMPIWRKLKSIAHTLPYDGVLVKEYQRGMPLPTGRWASVTVPVLVTDGGKSPVWMRNGNRALANVLPDAQYRTLEGQRHAVKAAVHAPILAEFFRQQSNPR